MVPRGIPIGGYPGGPLPTGGLGGEVALPVGRAVVKVYTIHGWAEIGNDDLVLPHTGWVYLGEKNADGTVRMGQPGGEFVVQKRIAGVYTTGIKYEW